MSSSIYILAIQSVAPRAGRITFARRWADRNSMMPVLLSSPFGPWLA